MSAEHVPILDIRRFDQRDAAERSAFVRELNTAYREFGFVGITRHEIPEALIADAYRAVKAFFALPIEAKAQYEVPGSGGAFGHEPTSASH